VVVPVFNRADTVRRSLASVLAQTVDDFELIVVDDGSTDDSGAVISRLSDPRIHLLRSERNRGVSAARNLGARAARAPLLAFLDADDVWRPRFLEYCAAVLHDRSCDAVRTGIQFTTPIHPAWYRVLVTYTPINKVMRTAVFKCIGGFDEEMRLRENDHFFSLLNGYFQTRFIPRRLVRWTRRPGNHLDRNATKFSRAPQPRAPADSDPALKLLDARRAAFALQVRECLLRHGVDRSWR
jgi:glycosyltransferase involved in cell wall biosynthesis